MNPTICCSQRSQPLKPPRPPGCCNRAGKAKKGKHWRSTTPRATPGGASACRATSGCKCAEEGRSDVDHLTSQRVLREPTGFALERMERISDSEISRSMRCRLGLIRGLSTSASLPHTGGSEKFSKKPICSVISQLWGGRTLVTRGLRPQLFHPAQKRVSNR